MKKEKYIYDVAILGAGASGLMCGAFLNKSLKVAIIDSNEKEAKKLKISGGGKCNITNVDVNANYYDGEFETIDYALNIFSKEMLLEFLHQNNLYPVIRKERYYFCKNSSDEIIDILKEKTKDIQKFFNTKVVNVFKEKNIFKIETSKKDIFAKNVVVATGGKSFKTLGASDIGLKIAKSFNIKVKEFTPALVGLTLQKEQFWMKELSGLSCYVNIKVANKTISEEMLFAHKGISGPAVLSASLYWSTKDITIDFLPNNNIKELIKSNSKKLVSSILPLPKRLSKALLKAVDVKDLPCYKINNNLLTKLLKIHSYSFAPAGNFGFTKAEVSKGGILVNELDCYTLQAKKVKGLYFIGEVVDVTGELGGYNFQWAFSSGVVCANAI